MDNNPKSPRPSHGSGLMADPHDRLPVSAIAREEEGEAKPERPISERLARMGTFRKFRFPKKFVARKKPPAEKKNQAENKQRSGAARGWTGRLLVWGVTAAIWGIIAVGGLVAYYAVDLPDLDQATGTTRRAAMVVQAANGETITAFGDVYGEPLTLAQMAPALPQAVMATEDRRFYSHFGIDLIGLARAFYTNFRAGHTVQGGSTITQQLAKNLFLKPDRTLKRKIQEALMALWIEHRFTKDQILTIYLNRVYLGSGTWGVDAAARRYFGVSARSVNTYQAAMIAGLLKAPSRYSPLNDPEASHARTVDVLNNMVAAGYIDAKQAEIAALTGAAQLIQRPVAAGHYFADWIKSQLDGMAEIQGKDVVVKTTLDISLDRAAEVDLKALITAQGEKSAVSQGAVVVLSPDGAVRAMVGGKDYDDSQFNRATQALRQPGSAFKPFVYLAAMEAGLDPGDTYDDAPITLGGWSPGNYNGRYQGPVTLRHAFADSINTVAVRLIERVGPRQVVDVAHRLGITTDLEANASLALGTSEATPLEMTTAYAAFANGGKAVTAYGIEEVDDTQGNVLYRRQGAGMGTVIAPRPLAKMHELMTAVVTEGTGKSARLDRPVAGKTGTTQDYRDAWFLGFTADYVTGVWLGNDDQRHAMKKVTGGSLPAQLWKQVMTSAERGLPARPLYLPPDPDANVLNGAVGAVGEAVGEAAHSAGNAIGDLINSIFGK